MHARTHTHAGKHELLCRIHRWSSKISATLLDFVCDLDALKIHAASSVNAPSQVMECTGGFLKSDKYTILLLLYNIIIQFWYFVIWVFTRHWRKQSTVENTSDWSTESIPIGKKTPFTPVKAPIATNVKKYVNIQFTAGEETSDSRRPQS